MTDQPTKLSAFQEHVVVHMRTAYQAQGVQTGAQAIIQAVEAGIRHGLTPREASDLFTTKVGLGLSMDGVAAAFQRARKFDVANAIFDLPPKRPSAPVAKEREAHRLPANPAGRVFKL